MEPSPRISTADLFDEQEMNESDESSFEESDEEHTNETDEDDEDCKAILIQEPVRYIH
jgi:hypothetical protein